MRRMAAAAALLLAANCGAPTAPTPAAEALELRLQTAHFRILGGRVSDATLRAAADWLETEYPRVLSDLGVAGVSVVTVKVWQDEAAFASESQRYSRPAAARHRLHHGPRRGAGAGDSRPHRERRP